MEKNKEFLELLRHYRHDWLNVLQLIKGNMALNQPQRVEEIIQAAVRRSANESKLSNLQMPKLAFLLITHNWRDYFFHLDYEVSGEIVDLSYYDDALYDWCRHFFQLIHKTSSFGSENSLLVTFQLLPDDFRLIFDYSGHLINEATVDKWLNNEGKRADKLIIVEKYVTMKEFVVEIKLT